MSKKTVIDCNVIISAAITNGNCRKVIRDILKNHQNYISKEILLEYKEVINRPKFKSYKSLLIELLEIICRESFLVEISDLKNEFCLPDKNDEIYLKTAIKAQVDFLITGNLKDFSKKKYGKLEIISPIAFLNQICKKN